MRYTISEMAALLGVTTHTLRYYEKMGLIQPEVNRETGYVIIRSPTPGGSTCAGSCGRRALRWRNARTFSTSLPPP